VEDNEYPKEWVKRFSYHRVTVVKASRKSTRFKDDETRASAI
jgi:hypothetical protein